MRQTKFVWIQNTDLKDRSGVNIDSKESTMPKKILPKKILIDRKFKEDLSVEEVKTINKFRIRTMCRKGVGPILIN